MNPRRHIPTALLIASVACRAEPTAPASPEAAEAASALVSAPLTFSQLSAGTNQTCGVTLDSRAYCWGGFNSGDGTTVLHITPVAVAGGHLFRNISSGALTSCGVTTDYVAYCWEGSAPVAVPGGLRFRVVSAFFEHVCGVSYPDNRAYCWGKNANGELGDGTRTNRVKPVAVAGGHLFRHVEPGISHTCGVTTDNRAYCWGSDEAGQLGDGPEARGKLRPVLVAGGYSFRQLDVGEYHTCAVTVDNRAFCWGYGDLGQLGNGKTLNRFTPRAVAGGLTFDRVTAGANQTCGESLGNRVYCWGWNLYGELGDGTTTMRLKPVPVAGGFTFAQVSTARDFHTCGKTVAGLAYCWGFNSRGELGDGTQTNRLTPTAVVGPGSP